jgi:lysozyme family protein
MASFERFLPILLKFEGGYSNNPSDPGGETNKGITLSVFRQYSPKLLGLQPTSANLKALTNAQAAILYKVLYWDKIEGDSLQVQELANIVCDFYVNAGSKAVTLLQRVLNTFGAELKEDGIVSQSTLQALDQFPPDKVHNAYKKGRIAYYRALGEKFPQFLQGWLNRVNAFPDLPANEEHADASGNPDRSAAGSSTPQLVGSIPGRQ